MLADDLQSFNSIHSKLLNHPGSELRHCPMKLYLPRAAQDDNADEEARKASLRVIQAPVSPFLESGTTMQLPRVFEPMTNVVQALHRQLGQLYMKSFQAYFQAVGIPYLLGPFFMEPSCQ